MYLGHDPEHGNLYHFCHQRIVVGELKLAMNVYTHYTHEYILQAFHKKTIVKCQDCALGLMYHCWIICYCAIVLA